MPLLLPAIQEQFDLTIGELAWVFNSYGIAVALGVLLGGWLGDLFKAKNIFGIGVLFFALGSTLVALATTFESVIFGRVLQGFGGGIFSPLVPLLLTKAAPRRPGKVLIVWGSVVGYVAASAPLVYSNFLSAYGWNLAFFVFTIVSIASVIFVFGSDIGNEPRARVASRTSYKMLFSTRELWLMIAYVFCTYGTITYFLFRLPLWLSESGYQEVSIGLALSALWLSFSLVSTLLRNKVDAPHLRSILLIAPVLITFGFLLATLCSDVVCFALASVLVGSGLACSNAPSTQMILRAAPKGASAVSASLDITFARLGGVATVTAFAQSTFEVMVLAVFFMCLVALACAKIVVDPHKGMNQNST